MNGVKVKENGENPQKKPKHIETPKEAPKSQTSFTSRSPEESSKKQSEEGEPKEKSNIPSPSIVKTQERGTAAQPNKDRSLSAASSDSEESEDIEDDESVPLTSKQPEAKATKSTQGQKELANANPSEGKTSDKQDDEESSIEESEESEEQSEEESASSSSDEEQTEPSTMNNKRKAEPELAQNVNPSPKRMKIEQAESGKTSGQSSSEESSSDSESDDDESDPEPEPKPQPKPEPRAEIGSKRLTLKQLKEQTLNRNPVRPSISDPPPQPSGSRARSRSTSSSDSDSSSSSSNG